MKWRYKIRCISCLRFVFVATWVLSAGVARAQNIPEIDIENDPGYKETQKFLAKTQSIIEKSRAETNAQAKDLEALANRVGELISNIGSTNEDASNLRSELSVQTDLLNIERETTEGLRRQMLILSKNMDTQKKIKTDIEAKLQSVIASLRAENTKGKKRLNKMEAQKKTNSTLKDRLRARFVSVRTERDKALMRLNQDLEKNNRLTKSNQAMASDLSAAKAEVERLKKEIRLVKEKLVLPEKNSAR